MNHISINMKRLIEEEGRTQKWVFTRMNQIDPSLHLTKNKFSQIMTGKRKVSGEELIAFCKALSIQPDEFLVEVL